MSVTLWAVGVSVLNLALGALLMLGVFKFMEHRVSLGASGGVVVGTVLIYSQATLGGEMLQVSVAEMKILVIAAALGAVVGVVGTVLVVKPDL